MDGAKYIFEAIGTHWQIDIYEKITDDKKSVIFNILRNRIEEFESVYSRFRKDSLFAKISKESGVYEFPDDAKELFDLYEKLYEITKGKVTPLIGNLLSEAGYDSELSFQEKKLNKLSKLSEIIKYEYPNLIVNSPTILDFGAIGKGYMVDIVGKILEENDINSYCVDAGGDIKYKSAENKNINIGLENPSDNTQVVGKVELSNKSICGSSGSRRSWGNFHHIIDPDNLISPKQILAIWVIANNTFIADAMTSCLFFVEPEIMLPHFDFDYAIIYEDFSLRYSNNFNGEFFS